MRLFYGEGGNGGHPGCLAGGGIPPSPDAPQRAPDARQALRDLFRPAQIGGAT